MIFVRRDPNLIPEGVLRVAERAQAELEALPAADRIAFIKKRSYIWKRFKRYLRQMSYGKCWYSESPDPQSFFDVDHFRPKAEAKRNEQNAPDDGYPWLAFYWDNFRYSAGRSNRLSSDEDTDDVVGKGSWFPLSDGSAIASWDNRCLQDERPILLDPTNADDMSLIKVSSDGLIKPTFTCAGTNLFRVEQSVKFYGLDLQNLREARLRVMRDVQQKFETLMQMALVAQDIGQVADRQPLAQQAAALKETTMPMSPYSLAARCKLLELPEGAQFIARPEDLPVAQGVAA